MSYPNAQQRIDAHLQEGKQLGKVYHWTSSNGASGIGSDNGFRSNAHDARTRGAVLSVTRDKDTSFWPYDEVDWRFTLDGDKITQHHKVGPYSDSDTGHTRASGRSEAEEEIYIPRGKKLGPLKKYVTKVEWFGPFSLADAKEVYHITDDIGDIMAGDEYDWDYDFIEKAQWAYNAMSALEGRGLRVVDRWGQK